MRSKVRKEAERDAFRLARATFKQGFPVDTFGMVERLGIQVCEPELDQDTLGALFMKPGAEPRIVVNRRHSFLRRRLACALEIAHYVQMSRKALRFLVPRDAMQYRLVCLGMREPDLEAA